MPKNDVPKKWYFEIEVIAWAEALKNLRVKEKEYKLFLAFWRKVKIDFTVASYNA